MEIEEAMFVEILMDGNGHVMANTHHGTKGVGAETQMSKLTHILKGLSLLLHRVVTAAQTIYFQLVTLNLNSLPCSLTFYQHTGGTDTSTGSDVFQQLSIRFHRVNNNLDIFDR